MRGVVVKGFILLDVLFGMSLLLAVVLLCGYFEQLARGFGGKSAARRSLIAHYYHVCMDGTPQAPQMPAVLQFEQYDAKGAAVYFWRQQGVFTVVHDDRVAADYLYVRFDEDAP